MVYRPTYTSPMTVFESMRLCTSSSTLQTHPHFHSSHRVLCRQTKSVSLLVGCRCSFLELFHYVGGRSESL
ncbi:hypothetical protein K435DRAFT_195221 [Dendrothele bispora CBS 962.96]|uniref:Uncharacterized protein n=1 Tax=Dendrothele bispora (strain CBS 962.96) TaxID=1314807 RepID=A0A4V4HF32_DENBC|nr:hypothetical protein K435DRAFT_195221 [Dendrothele bispora CBS 962.96]